MSLALLDGHVIRTDGHFKVPRRIMGAGSNQCMIAYIGCGGFLLKEVDLVASESCDSYLRGMESILIARRDHGLGPADVICDNPSVISGRVDAFYRGIWGGKSPRCIFAGDPVRRKIELEQSVDSTHQDARFGMRDFAYIVRRLGNLLDIGEKEDARTDIQNLESHVRNLYASARRANIKGL